MWCEGMEEIHIKTIKIGMEIEDARVKSKKEVMWGEYSHIEAKEGLPSKGLNGSFPKWGKWWKALFPPPLSNQQHQSEGVQSPWKLRKSPERPEHIEIECKQFVVNTGLCRIAGNSAASMSLAFVLHSFAPCHSTTQNALSFCSVYLLNCKDAQAFQVAFASPLSYYPVRRGGTLFPAPSAEHFCGVISHRFQLYLSALSHTHTARHVIHSTNYSTILHRAELI